MTLFLFYHSEIINIKFIHLLTLSWFDNCAPRLAFGSLSNEMLRILGFSDDVEKKNGFNGILDIYVV